MTQEQFSKYSYRHSEIIIYHQIHPEKDIEMMLTGVDFDNGLFLLVPFDDTYEDKTYRFHFSKCDKKRAQMRIIKCGQKK